jgi:hypothetical protein
MVLPSTKSLLQGTLIRDILTKDTKEMKVMARAKATKGSRNLRVQDWAPISC